LLIHRASPPSNQGEKEHAMNWTQIEGQWLQLTGQVKSQWGKLTDDDITNIGGKKDQLVGKLVTHYGVLREEAEKQIDAWLAKVKPDPEK
jgi:uncharacterized protein YjbJ (UPF0337 family)